MNTCGTCKNWGERVKIVQEKEIHICDYVVMFWDATEWVPDDVIEPSEETGWSNVRALKDRFKNQKSFVKDASDYKAELLTMADFGCNQWQAKQEIPT